MALASLLAADLHQGVEGDILLSVVQRSIKAHAFRLGHLLLTCASIALDVWKISSPTAISHRPLV